MIPENHCFVVFILLWHCLSIQTLHKLLAIYDLMNCTNASVNSSAIRKSRSAVEFVQHHNIMFNNNGKLKSIEIQDNRIEVLD